MRDAELPSDAKERAGRLLAACGGQSAGPCHLPLRPRAATSGCGLSVTRAVPSLGRLVQRQPRDPDGAGERGALHRAPRRRPRQRRQHLPVHGRQRRHRGTATSPGTARHPPGRRQGDTGRAATPRPFPRRAVTKGPLCRSWQGAGRDGGWWRSGEVVAVSPWCPWCPRAPPRGRCQHAEGVVAPRCPPRCHPAVPRVSPSSCPLTVPSLSPWPPQWCPHDVLIPTPAMSP